MTNPPSLTARVFRGGFWILAIQAASRAIGGLRTLILARVLLPDDFGLMGIALLAKSVLETFTTPGFDSALVQRQSFGDEFWDTAWIVAIVRGVGLGLLIALIAPAVALFFGRPEATWIIRAIGLSIFLGGFTNPSAIRYVKEMTFHRQFAMSLAATLADAGVAIPVALVYGSVWALVAGMLAGAVASVVVSWLVHPVRVRLRFDRTAARELFGFGRWVTGSGILNFLLTQGDDIVAGRLLGTASLGFYQMAYRISNLPATAVTKVLSSVTLPAYTQLQDDPRRVGAAFLRVLRMTSLLSFPVAALVFLLGPDFTSVVLGPHWVPMVPTMQILALYGLVFSVGAAIGPVFYAVGRPQMATGIQFVKLIIMAALIFPMTLRWGLEGTAWAVTGATLIVNPVADYLVMREVRGRLRDFLAALWPAALITLGMGLATGAVVGFLPAGLVRLVIASATATFVFSLLVVLFERGGRLGLLAEYRAAGERQGASP